AAAAAVADSHAYRLTGLRADSTYRARVRAISRCGRRSAWSAPASLSTASPPTDSWRRLRPSPALSGAAGRGGRFQDRGSGAAYALVPPTATVFDASSSASAGSGWTPPSADPPTAAQPAATPAARSGAAAAALADGRVCFFGGFGDGQDCTGAVTDTTSAGENPRGAAAADGSLAPLRRCALNGGLSNELWCLEAGSRRWRQVTFVGPAPPPRHGHSMSVIGGSRLVVFGGRGGPSDDGFADGFIDPVTTLDPAYAGNEDPASPFFDDIWELELDPRQRVTAVALPWASIPEGFLFTDAIDVRVSSNGTAAVIGAAESMCISAMSVSLNVSHPCARQLRISLQGPAPFVDDPAVLLQYNDGFGGDAGMGFGDASGGSGDGGGYGSYACHADVAATFADADSTAAVTPATAAEGGWTDIQLPAFAPLEPLLAKFGGRPAGGTWKLEIYDREVDSIVGMLESWSLAFTLRPCDPTAPLAWTQRGNATTAAKVAKGSGNTWITARATHAAVVVEAPAAAARNAAAGLGAWLDPARADAAMFVLGGRGPAGR
ncbi:unnamed protein product, partial [Phaeothamnion confervicola]